MKNEKNFYDIISSKFNEREIPFDEENWRAMKQMIDASRTDKKRVLWLVASLSLLLCAGGAFAIYQWNNHRQQSKAIYTNVSTTNNSSQTIAATNKAVANSTEVNKTNVSNNTSLNNNETTTHSLNTANLSAGKNQASTDNQNLIATSVKQKSIKWHNRIATNNKIASNNSIASAADIVSSGAVIQSNSTSGSGQNNSVLVNKESFSHSPVSNKTTKSPGSVKVSASVTGKASIRKTDKADSVAASEALPQRFSNEPRIFLGKTNLFSVDAGIQYSGGWEVGSVDQGKGINVMLGVGYSHYLGGRWFIKAGLLFSTFGNMSPLTYNYQHSVGRVIYDSVITTQRLYFLKLPIQMEYFVGRSKRSSIGFGGTLWYLVGNTGYATTYQQVDNTPPTNVVKYSENTPLDGYAKFNASAHIFYRYVISRKFSIYIIPYAELTNMKDNSFFGEKIIERTHGLEGMLSYNLN